MTIVIQPVKLDGQHYVAVVIGGDEMKPKGPFSSADAAEAMARRLLQFGRALASPSEWR
jgi:hypothetical protein